MLEVVEDVQDVPHSPRLLFDLRRELKTRHGDRLRYERVKGHAVTRERQTASLEISPPRSVSRTIYSRRTDGTGSGLLPWRPEKTVVKHPNNYVFMLMRDV